MKVGDRIRNQETGVEGVIKAIKDCEYDDCSKQSFTFNEPDDKVKFYHHTNGFEVIENEPQVS